jgi:D-alanyl-D-alanine carboxypeptidase (penicillin-binding protein 5/6)
VLARVPAVALALALWLVGTTGPALAGTGAAGARPTVDPAAPTPTAPYADGPPEGSAPDGSTVGGERLATRGLVVADGTPPLPDGVVAHGFLVADMDTGAVLAARDPHGRYYPASTLKTLTLLTLAPVLDPDTVVEGTVEDEAVEGSRVGIVHGGRYTVRTLFLALVLQSGNDAASALARAAGGVATTLAAMNATAERIQAYDTVAGTPSGLDVAGQSSSPYDLALVFRQLLAQPLAAEVLRTPVAQLPPVPGLSEGYQIQSQNPLLAGYPGDLGGKTGFTDAARHTFVTAAAREGRRLVVTLMDTERHPLSGPDQAARLLDWGFATARTTAGVGELVPPRADTPISLRDAGLLALGDGALPASSSTSTASANGPSPLVGAALAVTALLIVVATWVGRRRAVRWVPADDGSGDDGAVRRPPAPRSGAPTRAATRPPSEGRGPGGSPSTPR